MKIISIASGYDPNGRPEIKGLGEDNKLYFWDKNLLSWVGDWPTEKDIPKC